MMYQFIVSFFVGIVFEFIFSAGWSAALLGVLVSLSIFLVLFSQKEDTDFIKKFLMIGLAFALGIFRMSFVQNLPDQNLYKSVGQKIYFEATISEEPDVRDTSTRYTIRPNFSSEYVSECTDIFLLENSSCSPQSGSQGIQKHIPSRSLVLLVADRYPEFKYGDKIKISGRLDLPKNFLSREASAKEDNAEFDYINYLAKDKIHFLIYYPKIEKIEDGGNIFLSKLYNLKNIFIQKINKVVPEPNSSFLAGIIFGAKQTLGTELLDDFKKVGLIHTVVLSGYNITIIAAGVFYATSFLNKRKLSFLISAVSIILFAIMVGWGATVIRACVMSLISILAIYLGRPSDALRWLFIAGLLMLLWNPLLLFYDPSFQLSFMATLGLILFSEIIDKKFISQIIKLLIGAGAPVSFVAAFEKIKMREILSSTLAVQLFVLPLLIKMSGFVSPISFIVNPLILPLVPWAMALGALTGAAGILPFIGGILSWPFGILSYFLTQIIISITQFSARIPFATLQIGAVSTGLIFIWYTIYVFVFIKLKKNFVQ